MGSLSPDKFRIILINDNLLIVARVRIGRHPVLVNQNINGKILRKEL